MAKQIYPCLWFDGQAQAAAAFYCKVFKNSKITADNQMVVTFELNGMRFMGLNGGPAFKFNEAVSFVINTKDQAETDYYWDALTKNGGEEGPCGWCKDKYGLSWQVVPTEYFELIHSDDPAVREKAMKNTLKQKKLILSELK